MTLSVNEYCDTLHIMVKTKLLLTSLLCVGSYFVAGWSIELISLLVLAMLTMPLVMTDIKEHRLPNSLTLAGFLAGIGVSIIIGISRNSFSPLIHSLSVALLAGCTFLLLNLASRGGMGMGDVKLAVMLGALISPFGWQVLVMGFIVAFVLGAIFGLILLASKRANRKTLIPFGPYLLVGAWVSLFIGAEKSQHFINLFRLN